MTHVGDVDAEEEAAVLLIRIDAVIDVLRVLAVNRDNGEVAAIPPSRVLLGQRMRRAVRGGFCDGGRKALIEIVGAHDGEHVDPGGARLAEHLDDAPLGAAAFLGPLRNLDDNLAARLCAAKILFQNKDVAPDLRAVGRHEAERLAALERADDVRIRTVKDADDLALTRTPRRLGGCHTRHNTIAVHSGCECTPRHKDIRLVLRLSHVGDDEAESLRRHGEPPDDEIHAARQSVESAAIADDRPLRLERRERRRKQRLLLIGQPKSRAHLRFRQRAIGVLPHISVHTFLERI